MATNATELQTKIAREMNAIAERRSYLEDIVAEMDARKAEVDHAMEDHVTRLHDNIEAQQKRARKVFYVELEKYWSSILQETLQLDNVSSQLASLQMKEEETLAKFPTGLRSRGQSVSPLHNELHAVLGKLPRQQVFHAPFFSIEVPQNADEVVSSLVGYFRISEETDLERSASTPISNMTKPRILRGDVGEAEVTMRGTGAVVREAEVRVKEAKDPVKEAELSIPPQRPFKPGVEPQSIDLQMAEPLIFDLQTDAPLKVIAGRGKEPSAMSVRSDGKVWLVYRNRDPNLDLVDEHGYIAHTVRVGGNATGVAAYGDRNVVFVSQYRLTFLMFKPVQLDTSGALVFEEKRRILEIMPPMNPTSVTVGRSGCVVSSKTSLHWVDFTGGEIRSQCIVPDTKNSYLLKVCSTAVAVCQGQQLVCAADMDGHAVYFYKMEDGPDFFPLKPYKGEHFSSRKGLFTPISVSFHPRGFLGILDKTSESVVLLAMNELGAGPPLCTVEKSILCSRGVPTYIALGPGVSEDRPRLWVASSTGCLFHTTL